MWVLFLPLSNNLWDVDKTTTQRLSSKAPGPPITDDPELSDHTYVRTKCNRNAIVADIAPKEELIRQGR